MKTRSKTFLICFVLLGLHAFSGSATETVSYQADESISAHQWDVIDIRIDVRLPADAQGKMMSGTWFDPFSGNFDEPVTKKVTRWPSFKKPAGEGFRILIVEIQLGGKE